MRGTVIDRKRVNQPQGYLLGDHHNAAPVTHFCLRHNYLYYPSGWTDEATGREYKQGYYDENGQFYEDVAFLEDGKYKNVVCQCEYCDTITKIDWTEGGSLICPQCGGTMKLLSALDEYTQDPGYDAARKQPGYVDYADRNAGSARADTSSAPTTTASRRRVWAWIFGALLLTAVLVALGFGILRKKAPTGEPTGPSAPALLGENLRLNQSGPNVYTLSSGSSGNKVLYWDEDEESWHDPETDLWVWYNTDVTPPLWQYWYEPISGDYGDYGWMEYEDGTWFIEAEAGTWIELPGQYDSSKLWHIDTSPAAPGYDDSPEEIGPNDGTSAAYDDDDDTPEDLGPNGGTPIDYDDDTPDDIG